MQPGGPAETVARTTPPTSQNDRHVARRPSGYGRTHHPPDLSKYCREYDLLNEVLPRRAQNYEEKKFPAVPLHIFLTPFLDVPWRYLLRTGCAKKFENRLESLGSPCALVTGYWLLVTGYWLLVIGYLLLVIVYWLLVTGH